MGKVLLLAVVIVGLPILWVNVMAWTVWRRLRRRNEISATHPTRPPLRWLASPGPCARLHRRLRDALVVLRQSAPSPRRPRRGEMTPLGALAARVEAHALSLDRELMLAARMRGRSGTTLRHSVGDQIDEIERIAHRVAAASRSRSTTVGAESTAQVLQELTDHLDALDAAWDELTRIEQQAGLGVTV